MLGSGWCIHFLAPRRCNVRTQNFLFFSEKPYAYCTTIVLLFVTDMPFDVVQRISNKADPTAVSVTMVEPSLWAAIGVALYKIVQGVNGFIPVEDHITRTLLPSRGAVACTIICAVAGTFAEGAAIGLRASCKLVEAEESTGV
jgi:hypothetical protein